MYSKQKKDYLIKSILLLFIVMFYFVLLCGCTKGGNISQVTKNIGTSDIYTQEDIQSAMNVVTKYFKSTKGFQDCTLTELYYDEAISSKESESRAEQYEAEQAIVLLSSFDVAPSYEYGTLNPDSTYNNFKWILVRSNNKKWTLETWGY